MRHTGTSAWGFVLLAGLLLSGDLGAGSLEPPGPPAPTMKTLQQVESRIPIASLPTTISQPGSYYLTGNLTGPSGSTGMFISSSFVTLDLNGFSLIGVPGTFDGIRTDPGTKQIVIRNGTIRNWAGTGLFAGLSTDVHVENLAVDSNNNGINVGARSSVRDSSATNSAGTGIFADNGSTIVGCTAGNNAESGIVAQANVTVSGSTAVGNGEGFVLDGASTATDCTAGSNGLRGFLVQAGSRVARSTARQNSIGFQADGVGISIEQCTAELNTSNGIQVQSGALVRGNFAHGNAANGIFASGTGNQIEENYSTENDTGIRVNGTQNVIVKNRAFANVTAYSIVAGNLFGPVSTAPATAGPWANY